MRIRSGLPMEAGDRGEGVDSQLEEEELDRTFIGLPVCILNSAALRCLRGSPAWS
jgi:hypothetical protein